MRLYGSIFEKNIKEQMTEKLRKTAIEPTITEALTKIVAKLSAILYHKTDESKAIKILEENQFRLSTWLGSESDKQEKLWFLSTSNKKGAYKRESSGVIFVLDGAKLAQRYTGKPFDYWGPQYRNIDPKERDRYDEAEERIISDKPIIPNANKYITEIHAHWWMPSGETYAPHAYSRHRKLTLLAKKLEIPLYWHEKESALDTMRKEKAKKFSDFEAQESVPEEDLKKRGGLSAYTYKKWNALLSIEPAKSYDDLPPNIYEYISTYSDGHTGFMADIHNATKSMGSDIMQFVYKLQKQMKRVGAKDFKDFYWKMVDKIHQLWRGKSK